MSIDTINRLYKSSTVPSLTAQNRHRLARLAQTQLKALTITEAGAAGSFLWLLSFAEKESDDIASAIPKKRNPIFSMQHRDCFVPRNDKLKM